MELKYVSFCSISLHGLTILVSCDRLPLTQFGHAIFIRQDPLCIRPSHLGHLPHRIYASISVFSAFSQLIYTKDLELPKLKVSRRLYTVRSSTRCTRRPCLSNSGWNCLTYGGRVSERYVQQLQCDRSRHSSQIDLSLSSTSGQSHSRELDLASYASIPDTSTSLSSLTLSVNYHSFRFRRSGYQTKTLAYSIVLPYSTE